MHIVPCETARATPGLSYEDCPDGDKSYIEEPSSTACPICQRNETFRNYIDRNIASATVAPVSQRSNAPSSSTLVCGIGEHDLRDIDNGRFSCVKCGAIRVWIPASESDSDTHNVATPLVSFPDDDDYDDVSTPRASVTRAYFNAQSEATASEKTFKTVKNEVALQVHGPVEDAPTPSTMTSNAWADASWRLYEGQLGRRLPDF